VAVRAAGGTGPGFVPLLGDLFADAIQLKLAFGRAAAGARGARLSAPLLGSQEPLGLGAGPEPRGSGATETLASGSPGARSGGATRVAVATAGGVGTVAGVI
jgi:hypothetical protein